jgi:hypothetical protein
MHESQAGEGKVTALCMSQAAGAPPSPDVLFVGAVAGVSELQAAITIKSADTDSTETEMEARRFTLQA